MKEFNNFSKAYEEKKRDNTAGQADEMRLQQLTKKYQEESMQNKAAIVRRVGEKVLYGDEIMLVHYDSQNIIEASKTCAEFDKSCNLLRL